MSYRVVVSPWMMRRIQKWGLSDYVFVDVQLYLREILPTAPSEFLRRRR